MWEVDVETENEDENQLGEKNWVNIKQVKVLAWLSNCVRICRIEESYLVLEKIME